MIFVPLRYRCKISECEISGSYAQESGEPFDFVHATIGAMRSGKQTIGNFLYFLQSNTRNIICLKKKTLKNSLPFKKIIQILIALNKNNFKTRKNLKSFHKFVTFPNFRFSSIFGVTFDYFELHVFIYKVLD